MNAWPTEGPEEIARALLVGTTLDRFCVTSLVLEMNFMRLPKVEKLPVSVWLSATGQATFLEASVSALHDIRGTGKDDFFESRGKFIGQSYRLIGQEISVVQIDPMGAIELRFEAGSLLFAGCETNFEEIWSITSDTPEPHGAQDWAVTLTDQQELVARRP